MKSDFGALALPLRQPRQPPRLFFIALALVNFKNDEHKKKLFLYKEQ